MKHLLFVIVAVVPTVLLFSQPQIKGVITIQNSKTETGRLQYVKGADVSAAFANPTISDDLGQFTLDFFNRISGDQADISIQKRGLEVVNADQLNTFIPAEQTTTLKVYMCEEGKLASTILDFRGIAESQITRRFEERIARLEQNNRASAADILRLEEERDLALRQYKNLARKLAVINLDEEPTFYTRAYQLFQENKIDEARTTIKNADLERQLAETKGSLELGRQLTAAAQKRIEGIANTYVLDAQMALADLDFEGAFESYDKAIQASDTTIIVHNFEYADILTSQYQLEKALNIYLKSLELSKDNLPLLAYNQFLIATTYLGRSEFTRAIEYMEKCIGNYSLLAEKNPEDYLPFLGVASQMMSLIYLYSGDEASHISFAKEGIHIFRQLADQQPDRYEPYLAWGMISGNQALEEGGVDSLLQLSRKLTQSNGEMYEVFVAISLFLKSLEEISMGDGQISAEDIEAFEARVLVYLEEAFAITKRQLATVQSTAPNFNLIINNPNSLAEFDDILPQADMKANMLFSYVGAFSGFSAWVFSTPDTSSNFWKLSRDVLDVSIAKCRVLMRLNPDRYTPHFIEMGSLLGVFYSREGAFEKAIALLDECYLKTDTLFQRDQQAFELILSVNRTFFGLAHGMYYAMNGTFREGMNRENLLKVFENSKQTLQKYEGMAEIILGMSIIEQWEAALQKSFYPEFLASLAYRDLETLIGLSYSRNDYLSTLYYSKKRLEVLEDLVSKYFVVDKAIELLEEYDTWIELYAELESYDSVMLVSNKQVELAEHIWLATESDELKEQLAVESGNNAWYNALLGNFEEAIRYANLGLRIDPDETWINTNLALGYLGNEDFDSALRLYAEYYNSVFDEESGQSFREVFMGDLDSLEVAGTIPDAELLKRARKVLDRPGRMPKDLLGGIRSLRQLHESYERAKLTGDPALYQSAAEGYERFLQQSIFLMYFKPDFERIILQLADCYRKSNWDLAQLPLPDNGLLLAQTASSINLRAVNSHKYAATKEYDDLIFHAQLALRLREQAEQLAPSQQGGRPRALVIYAGNLATYHLFSGAFAEGLALLEQEWEASPDQLWLVSKLIVAHILNDDLETARTLYQRYVDEPYSRFDSFKSLKERVSYDLYKLRKSNLKQESIRKAVTAMGLYE